MTDTAPEVSPPTSTAPGRIKVPSFVGCFGKKGSGKSYLAATLWLSYTGDRLCIDPTGDVWDKDLQGRPGVNRIEGGFAPDRWPKKDDERRASIVYQPQRRDARWRQMVDSWIRLAMERGRICVWFDEFGLVTTNNYTPPETADLLHTGRHREITLIECAPRPKRIDPLGLTQLDMIYMFELPAPRTAAPSRNRSAWTPAPSTPPTPSSAPTSIFASTWPPPPVTPTASYTWNRSPAAAKKKPGDSRSPGCP